MADHHVRRTLERDVLPYLASARLLRQQWFYRLHFAFGYTTDIVAALAAVGIATPALSLVGAVSDTSTAQNAAAPTVSSVAASFPSWLMYPAAMVLVAWVLLRVAFNREEGQKRAVLAKSCTRTLRQAEASLAHVLNKPDPLPAITELLEKSIRPSVDRSIQEDAWPWAPFAPQIKGEVQRQLEALCGAYERDWAPAAPMDIRRV